MQNVEPDGKIMRTARGGILRSARWRDPAPLISAEVSRQSAEGAFGPIDEGPPITLTRIQQ